MTDTAFVPSPSRWIFVHGFLDDRTVWDGLIRELGPDVDTVTIDLPGSGDRAADTGPTTLARFAGEVTDTIDAAPGPVILVGQSMGAQVAELAAVTRPDRVRALVLVAPVPLAGTRLSTEATAPFRALGGQPDAQRALRAQLSPGLDPAGHDALLTSGLRVDPARVDAYVSLWNDGDPSGATASSYRGPVAIVRGELDGFSTAEVAAGVAARFDRPTESVFDGAGHWLHVERPDELAAILTRFVAGVPAEDATVEDAAAGAWRGGFSSGQATDFGASFAPDVVLEASALMRPVEGRAAVAAIMAAASSIYEQLTFTTETTDGSTSYLQWTAHAVTGDDLAGITVLTRDDAGLITRAAIHHRPLGGLQRFSRELRRRLVGVIDADHFEPADDHTTASRESTR